MYRLARVYASVSLQHKYTENITHTYTQNQQQQTTVKHWAVHNFTSMAHIEGLICSMMYADQKFSV